MGKHKRSFTATDIREELNNTRKITVSVTTVQHRLREYEFKEWSVS